MSIQVNTSHSASTALRNLAASQSGLAQPTVALSGGIRDRVVADTVEFDGKLSQVATENKIAASTPLRDSEMAAEMSKHTQENILAQPGVAMSAQANQSNSDVLQLLEPARK
ncbi:MULTISPECIES: flagellin [unclassified Cryobacterium]|uniref:flagellin n=1 Tax=unclassified Cryobacterium TaxID=2649013 RepID=UPI000CE52A0A|nr:MULTISPECIES: flagellin [unclassified Cryobacterium]